MNAQSRQGNGGVELEAVHGLTGDLRLNIDRFWNDRPGRLRVALLDHEAGWLPDS